jgi:quercetin dioxygenase-like cupin family protein
MTDLTTPDVTVRVLPAGDGDTSSLGGIRNRFMIDGADTDGRFALVEHQFAPRALAAPMHRHRDEDEYTYVLTGRIGAVIEGREVEAGAGDLLFKPRGQWHTFWNAGDEPASCLELISPAGLEQLFRSFAGLAGDPEPEQLAEMGAKYGCDVDFPATFPVVERHGLAL